MILKYVDSSQFNEAKHTQRLTELEELNTYVFDNVDGTRSVYVMHENVKYIDENGSIKEKDVSLISKKGGFGTVQNDIELLIPNNPTQGIDIEYSEFAVKLIPQDLTDKISAKQIDNSIVYEKAYGERTKLIYTPLLSGVKEDIILTEYTSDASYTFVLKTDGLNLYKNDSGYYLSKNSKDDPVFYLGEIIVYDAIGKPDVGTMTVQTVTAGEEYLLTVTANDDFLSDPTTVYPVTIDPSITVSENNADNSIIDAPIYQGYPDRNFATYTYNRVGTPSGNNGIGRTAVKLSGLTSQSAYQTITASQITDVTFHVREASGGSAQYINIYPLTSNTTWTETSMTWNSVGNWSTTLNCGNTMNGAQWTAFNITDLVKAWKNNTYSANAGFIMISNNESVDKSFCSSEYSSNTSYRPYVVMTYSAAISLNYSSLSIVEGGTRTLIATTQPSGQTVTWTTSNSAIATVSSTGVITAKKAGDVAIRAKIIDADGVSRYASCTVYVHLPNGVYYFNNISNNHSIEFFSNASYGENEILTAWESDATEPTERFQLFKFSYLGNGLYSIRSMLDNTKGWTRSDTQLKSTTIGTSDLSVPATAKWHIKYNGNGYYIYSQYGTSKTVTCPDDIYDDFDILLTSYSSSNVLQCWNIKKINASYRGIDIRASKSSMSIGESYTFVATTYSTYDGEYSIPTRWETGNSRIASIVETTGLLTAKNSGKIPVTVYMNNYPSIKATVNLTVKAQTVQTTGIKSGAVYMIKNASKGTYLTATNANTLMLSIGDPMDGKQLWYVEWTGNAYKLYSMGIKAAPSGSSESFLKGNTVSNSPIVSTIASASKWTISNHNGDYYLVNDSASFNNTSLSANSSNNNVMHVSLENENTYAGWDFEEIDTTTFNNYWTGDLLGQGDTIYIKVNIDNSVYSNSIISSDDFDVIDQWKNKSNHVVIYGPNDTVPSNISAFEVTFIGYVPSGNATVNGVPVPWEYVLYGQTNGYQNVQFIEKGVSGGSDWDGVIISLNISSSSPLVGNEDKIRKTIIHEMGHALKLAHPKDVGFIQNVPNGRGTYLDDNSVSAIMNQGDPNITSNLACATPKWHDIISLKNKWGE